MIETYEQELIQTIKEVHPNTSPYMGEFDNKEELELLVKGLEAYVFVEFVSERYINPVSRSVIYNIHIFTSSSSKTQKYRQNNRYAGLLLCEKIDEKLRNSVLCNEFRLQPKSLKVSLNEITQYGYTHILTREIESELLEKDEFLLDDNELSEQNEFFNKGII
ncbi:hypothetical protein CPIN18021_1092 [Campylobacter pinnipediorum subsp. caledonicus]|uniref:Uncharacterized protein n=1 Tax=Campylobacter pinnipediorum subsp. caledonicus TaxID=1874362 RepID=A0A1S6U811_9BACT|nr:hypothetical protein [Campylobacter pinnipediorum]AQW85479.1 hypothetical protein CPIN18020_0232 [Campylobacter pinnipediorum subsp. caledonicus]AQW87891.1 hypothetical protein CPIN18021_1092 [Campylobacter pinnipediorum subsp. caledonicus]